MSTNCCYIRIIIIIRSFLYIAVRTVHSGSREKPVHSNRSRTRYTKLDTDFSINVTRKLYLFIFFFSSTNFFHKLYSHTRIFNMSLNVFSQSARNARARDNIIIRRYFFIFFLFLSRHNVFFVFRFYIRVLYNIVYSYRNKGRR